MKHLNAHAKNLTGFYCRNELILAGDRADAQISIGSWVVAQAGLVVYVFALLLRELVKSS